MTPLQAASDAIVNVVSTTSVFDTIQTISNRIVKAVIVAAVHTLKDRDWEDIAMGLSNDPPVDELIRVLTRNE